MRPLSKDRYERLMTAIYEFQCQMAPFKREAELEIEKAVKCCSEIIERHRRMKEGISRFNYRYRGHSNTINAARNLRDAEIEKIKKIYKFRVNAIKAEFEKRANAITGTGK